jgi:hypothetical protein
MVNHAPTDATALQATDMRRVSPTPTDSARPAPAPTLPPTKDVILDKMPRRFAFTMVPPQCPLEAALQHNLRRKPSLNRWAYQLLAETPGAVQMLTRPGRVRGAELVYTYGKGDAEHAKN